MTTITLVRQKDYLILFRTLKIYVNHEFVNYFQPNEKIKEIDIENDSDIKVKVDWCSSNIVNFSEGSVRKKEQFISVSSQIHNGLFIIIFGCFITGNILKIFDLVGPYLYITLVVPIAVIVGQQIFGRNKYLRLTKK